MAQPSFTAAEAQAEYEFTIVSGSNMQTRKLVAPSAVRAHKERALSPRDDTTTLAARPRGGVRTRFLVSQQQQCLTQRRCKSRCTRALLRAACDAHMCRQHKLHR